MALIRIAKRSIVTAAAALLFTAGPIFGQTVVAPPQPPAVPLRAPRPQIGNFERSIAVDPNVSIKMPCVSGGNVAVNGWSRNEVRVLVEQGSPFEIKVQQRSENGSPVWILIGSAENASGPDARCLRGRIDIDAPFGSFFDLTGRRAATVVESVKKAKVTNLEGNITMRNIKGGLVAATYQGDISVENSSGEIALESSTGNVFAFQVQPGEPGDLFRAKTTNGTISLQNVEHRQIDAGSISGSVLFDGRLLSGGLYRFKTSNGALRLTLPADSSGRIIATYGFGSFNSQIPVKTVTENITDAAKIVQGEIGSGDSTVTVNLSTTTGNIMITKKN